MKDNLQRSKTIVIFIWIILVLEIAMMLSSYLQYDLLKQMNDGVNISDEKIDANDMREVIVGLLYTIAYIISTVTFIQWFRRAYFNLHTKVRGLSFNEGWAAGSWFVPILNLFRPYQIMKELYVDTTRLLSKHIENFRNSPILLYVNIWWFFWIVNYFVSNTATRLTIKANTIDELITSSAVDMVSSMIGIPLCLITIKVIKDYSILEEQLFNVNFEDDSKILNIDYDDDILDAPLT